MEYNYQCQLGGMWYNHYLLILYFLGGKDYNSKQYFAIFPAGEVVSHILVDIIDDNFLEGTEYFTAELTIPEVAAGYGVKAGSNCNSEAQVNILNDKEEHCISFSLFNSNSVSGDTKLSPPNDNPRASNSLICDHIKSKDGDITVVCCLTTTLKERMP